MFFSKEKTFDIDELENDRDVQGLVKALNHNEGKGYESERWDSTAVSAAEALIRLKKTYEVMRCIVNCEHRGLGNVELGHRSGRSTGTSALFEMCLNASPDINGLSFYYRCISIVNNKDLRKKAVDRIFELSGVPEYVDIIKEYLGKHFKDYLVDTRKSPSLLPEKIIVLSAMLKVFSWESEFGEDNQRLKYVQDHFKGDPVVYIQNELTEK